MRTKQIRALKDAVAALEAAERSAAIAEPAPAPLLLPEPAASIYAFWQAPNDAYFTPRTIALVLELSKITLANWRSTGNGPRAVKMGRVVYYVKSDILAWLGTFERA